MSKLIKIKKGLDLNLKGRAENTLSEVLVQSYAVKPTDYIGVTPKLMVKEGDRVMAGSPLFFAKHNEKILFTSPISGIVTSINRGERRVIEEIRITPDNEVEYVDFGNKPFSSMTKEEIIDKLLISGTWTYIRQRPYSIIPNPNKSPKCIVISGFDSSPLAPDYSILLKNQASELQLGVDIISKLTQGKIYVNSHISKGKTPEILGLKNVVHTNFDGPHPSGNVGVQISNLEPINKGENVWYIHPADLVMIGKLFLHGKLITDKIIALTGSETIKPQYYNIKRGACISSIINNNVNGENHLRYISGNILTGKKIESNGYIGAYDNQITVIKEGDYYEFLGWILPGLKKFSFSRTFLSGFLRFLPKQFQKPIEVDTNLHGGQRAYVMTGEFEKVFPFDIYPLQLIKACIIEDIDQMEELGIYEIDAEDFALCEVIDTSKTDIQDIIRKGLELIRKEMGE